MVAEDSGWKLAIEQAQLVQSPPELRERREAQAEPPISGMGRATHIGHGPSHPYRAWAEIATGK